MKYSLLLITLLVFTVSGCKSTNAIDMDKLTSKQFDTVKSILKNKKYAIDITAVYPFNSAATTRVLNALLIPSGDNSDRIDVAGDRFFLKVIENKSIADLPFYGERRIGGDYGGNSSIGIAFDTEMKDYTIKENLRKKIFNIDFNVHNSIESYNINMTVSHNRSVSININSLHSNTISYSGKITSL